MKDFLNQFDLDNAFKALDELEYPTVKGGIRPNRVDLHEHFSRKQKTDLLIEEYYNVSSGADLEAAQDQREDEIAQAKLDRIEKIVDLDADSEEDLQAAYVGKFVVQCPQCMTLFYKKPEDVTTSEEDPTLANVGELCPNCSNDSGFTVVGKIEDATPEAAPVEEAPAEGEETGMDEVSVEGEEAPAEGGEEDLDLDLDLGDLDLDIEETEEQEPAEESLNLSKALQDASKKTELDTENHSENLTLNESNDKECEDGKCDGNCEGKECDESLNNSEAQKDASKNTELDTENHSENLSLNESADVKAELKDYNEYIEYLQKQIAADEEELKKANNDFVKDSIQRRLDGYKADLDAAMPQILKDAVDEQAVADEEVDAALDDIAIEADVSTDAATLQDEAEAEAEAEEKGTAEEFSDEETETKFQEALNEGFFTDGGKFDKLADKPISAIVRKMAKINRDRVANALKDVVDKKLSISMDEFLNRLLAGETIMQIWADDKGSKLPAEEPVTENCEGKECKEDVNILSGNSSSIDLGDAGAAIGAALPLLADDEGEKLAECDKALKEAGEPSEAELDRLYDSKEFRTPVSQSVIDNFFNEAVDEVEIKDIEELDDNSLTETVTKYLKEVYDNVNSFSLTGCQFNEGTSQLLIKGDINFTSGKTKPTTFAFNPCGNRFFEGYNFDLCDTKAFRLYGKMKDKTFFTEGIRYSYHIQDNLVEGLIRN